MSVKESSEYDNYMEEDARKNDSYSVGLDKFFDEPLPVVLQDMTKAKKVVESDVWKSIYVHFKTQADMVEFCTKINQMAAFGQMSEQVTRMQALADDLIMISRLEADSQEPSLQAVDINGLLHSIVSEAQALSGGKHIITLDCKEEAVVQADGSDIRSALSNIIFNAVRHNPDGASITILVSQYQDFIDVSIRDDGVGIDPMEIPRLTERFYRGDNSRNSATGGTGLGLAIVKHSINRYGGRLMINSRLGHGAEFICRLPKERK